MSCLSCHILPDLFCRSCCACPGSA
jgi:hypothetical protein